jgi:hypothetical protein
VGKGEEACVLGPPLDEKSHHRLEQTLADAVIPDVGAYRQWPEECQATPVSREVRTYKLAAKLGPESGSRVSQPACLDVVGITAEQRRFREANGRAESQPMDMIGGEQITLSKWSNRDVWRYHPWGLPRLFHH